MPFGLDWMDMLMGGAGIATGAGAIAQGIGQAGAYEDQQKAARRLRGVAQQPLDPMQFYRPMSEAERVAFQRSIKADLASRGIPFDSSYATALTSELMAKTEGERWNAAVQQAISGRQTVQSGLVGGMPPPYPNANYAGAMSSALGYFGNKYGQPRQAAPAAGAGASPDPNALADLSRVNPFDFNRSFSGSMPSVESQYASNPQDAYNQWYLPRASAGLEGHSGTIGPYGNLYGSNYYPIEDPAYTGATWSQPGGGRGMSGLPGLGY